MGQKKKLYIVLAITISICAIVALVCYQDIRKNYCMLDSNNSEKSTNQEISTSSSQLDTTTTSPPTSILNPELIEGTEYCATEGTGNGPTIIEFGHSFYDTRRLSEGHLKYTIKGAQLINNFSDLCRITGFMHEEFLALNEENRWEEQELPFYINNDFEIKDSHYFVLIDIIVENQGAACFTAHDLDIDGYSMGRYDDPYLFRADVLYLVNSDIKDPVDAASYIYSTIDYFSLKDTNSDYPDNHVTYRLEPGETVEFSIGYHFDDETYAVFVPQLNISSFYVTTTPFADGYFAELNLED